MISLKEKEMLMQDIDKMKRRYERHLKKNNYVIATSYKKAKNELFIALSLLCVEEDRKKEVEND